MRIYKYQIFLFDICESTVRWIPVGERIRRRKMKVFKWIEENLEEFIMCILLIAMACIMMIQVIARFVFSNSLGWSEAVSYTHLRP